MAIEIATRSLTRRRGIIFDLDGTLVELKFQVSEAKAAVIQDLGQLGFDTSQMSAEEPTQTILDNVALQLQRQKRGDAFSALRARVDQILNEFEMEAFKSTRLLPSVKSTLNYLKNHGFKLALVTNNGTVPSQMTLERLGLSNHFEIIITRDDVKKMKPNGEGIRKAMKQLRLKPSNCLYVGDSYVDVLAARDAGIKIASLLRRDSAVKILRESPDYIIGTPRHLTLLFQ